MQFIVVEILEMKERPKEWTQLLVITLSKKGNFKNCQSCHTISLIRHPSKFMLRVILNKFMLRVILNPLRAKAEKLLAEEQAGFRPGQSTVEQILISQVIIERRLRRQCSLSKITFLVGPQESLLATVKRWKLVWFGHVTCQDSLSKTILQGTLKTE